MVLRTIGEEDSDMTETTRERLSYGATGGLIRGNQPGGDFHGVDCTLVEQSTGTWVCRLVETRGMGQKKLRIDVRNVVSGYGPTAWDAARQALQATSNFGWCDDAHFFAATAVDRVLWKHKDGGL